MIIDTEAKDKFGFTCRDWIMEHHDGDFEGKSEDELTDFERGIRMGLRLGYFIYEGDAKGEYWYDGKWCVDESRIKQNRFS